MESKGFPVIYGGLMKTIVISLGGSVIVPDTVDFTYLNHFKTIIRNFSRKNKVVIVTGGGKTAREYLRPLQAAKLPERVASLVGIASTRLNARLVAGIFGITNPVPETVEDVVRALKTHTVVICGALGERKNMTSDGNAAEVAARLGADYFLNITNVKGLYTKDPHLKGATFIPCISYEDFLTIINKINYRAGQHFVLDQAAARLIKQFKIKTYIIGRDLPNLTRCLGGKSFIGTVIG